MELIKRADKVNVGDRIAINAMWCINPSMVNARARRIPMACDVRWVRNLGTSVLIESIDNKVYEIPSGYIISVLGEPEEKAPMLALPEHKPDNFYRGYSID